MGYQTWTTSRNFVKVVYLVSNKDNFFYKKKEYRTSRPFKLIHINICDPITPNYFSEKMYFIIFIDEYIRKTQIYLLKEE